MRVAVLVLPLLLIPGAQTALSQDSFGRIEGTVVDQTTGAPVSGASVTISPGEVGWAGRSSVSLIRDSQPRPGCDLAEDRARAVEAFGGDGASVRCVQSNSAGRFLFDDLPPGAYRIGASAPGYVPWEYGQRSGSVRGVPLVVAASSSADVPLSIPRTATVAGAVTIAEEEPVSGVRVYLLRPSFRSDGTREFRVEREGESDDQGRYELSGIVPGRYYFAAGTLPSPLERSRDPEAPGFGWSFYPGVSDREQAGYIDVPPGAQFGQIDFLVSPLELRRVVGRVVDSRTGDPPEAASVSYGFRAPFAGGGLPDVFHVFVAYDPEDGTFVIPALADGSYGLGVSLADASDPRFAGPGQDAYSIFEVAGADVDDLVIRAPSGGRVHGRVRIEGDGALADVVATGNRGPRVRLAPLDPLQSEVFAYADLADGSFEMPVAVSGRYRLTVGAGRAYVADVSLNGSPVRDSVLFIPEGAASRLDVVLDPNGGVIEGVVVDSEVKPLADVAGLLVPDPMPLELAYYEAFRTDVDGRFTIDGIPPGEYLILAWDGLDSSDYFDRALLARSAPDATPVVIVSPSPVSVRITALERR